MKVMLDATPPLEHLQASIRQMDHLIRSARITATPERRGVAVARLTNIKRRLREVVAELERTEKEAVDAQR